MGEESLTTVPFDRTVEQVSLFSIYLSRFCLVWLHFLDFVFHVFSVTFYGDFLNGVS
jgi:hypothetical protein